MRSSLAVMVAMAVLALQVESHAFHVHGRDVRQDGDSHRHGPAIHDHAPRDVGEERHIDGDGAPAAGAVITIAIPAATVAAAVVVDVALTDTLRPPDLQLAGSARGIDARSHGPPPVRNSLLRGPPSFPLL